MKHHLRPALCSFKNHKKLALGRIRTSDLLHSSLTLCRCANLELIHDLEKRCRTRRRGEFVGGVWSRSLESLLCKLWGNFGGILEHRSIHLSARAVAERYFFGKFIPEVPSKSGSGRVGRTKTVPDFRVCAARECGKVRGAETGRESERARADPAQSPAFPVAWTEPHCAETFLRYCTFTCRHFSPNLI